MKQLFLRCAICLAAIAPFIAFGQDSQPPLLDSLNSSVVWEVGAAFADIDDQPSRLFYARMKAFATDRLAIGLHGVMFQRRTVEAYGQEVAEPQLGYGEFGFVTAYYFVNGNRFKLGGEAITGYATATIADKAVKVLRHTINGDFEVPKVLARNNYFQFKPELTATYRIGRYFGIQASGGYNFLMGRSRFLRSNDFDGWTVRAGVVLIIPEEK
jgi:hypothetical protein